MATPRRSAPPRPVVAAGDDLHADFGWTVSTFSEAFANWAGAAVASLPGGSRGYLVLDAISRGQPPSQLALARRCGVDKTAMTYLLDDLEQARLVTRNADPRDRRARQVALTARGRQTLERSRSKVDATEQRLLSVLDPSEATAFRSMLERVARAAHEETPGVGAMTSAQPRSA